MACYPIDTDSSRRTDFNIAEVSRVSGETFGIWEEPRDGVPVFPMDSASPTRGISKHPGHAVQGVPIDWKWEVTHVMCREPLVLLMIIISK